MKKHVIETREFLAFFLILLVVLAAGSLWDAPFSCAVYNESSRFGQRPLCSLPFWRKCC